MMSSSAFMRGEGTPAAVRCSTAAFRDGRSCTSLFHHGDASTAKKVKSRGQECPRHTTLALNLPLHANDRRRQIAVHHARRLLRDLLRLIVRDQGVDNRLQLPVHHLL